MAFKKTLSKTKIEVEGLSIQLHRKNVKNLNLRVYPGEQQIRMSIPRRLSKKAAIRFIKEKLPWIKKQLRKKPALARKPTFKYISGEKHFVWGKLYTLQVVEKNQSPSVQINEHDDILTLSVRPGTSTSKKASVLKEWYRGELKREIPKLIEKWEPEMNVSVKEFGVKQMKTRWGTCNIRDGRIWLNLELAKKRPELLKYVVVHEMVHLLERLHNKRFYQFMSAFLPDWKSLKNELNGKSDRKRC
jgi:predicted metal-dependent hydrolase